MIHKRGAWSAAVLSALVITLALFLWLFDWNMARPFVTREITAKTGRPASIDGDLRLHLLSWTPAAEIYGLTLKNPPWAESPLMFKARQITLSLSLGRLLRGQIVIPELKLVAPVVNLERDSKGRASWELGTASGAPNGNTQPSKIPTIQRLLIQDGTVHVTDDIRKLRFGGSVVAIDGAGKPNGAAFEIRAKGTLNEKPFRLNAYGGPLLALTPDKPYSFSLHVTASDINLDTRVTVPKPFDLGLFDAKFEVSGNDLADIYYLTGLAMPNTPEYRIGASVHVSGNSYRVDDLKGKVGSSDLAGEVLVENSGALPKLTATLRSRNLQMIDLAPTLGHAAGNSHSLSAPHDGLPKNAARDSKRAAPAGAADRLLPDADLQVNRVRGMDADVTYSANAVTTPKLPMKNLHFHVVLDNGLLSIDPLAFVLDEGDFSGSVVIDARADVPVTAIDMRMSGVDLAQFKMGKAQAPLSGVMQGRVQLHGAGGSVHKMASNADGAISLSVPHGEINQALAELTGINVARGLGLLLAKNDSKTAIRCGIIDFQAQQGRLDAKTLFMDTTDVLITGRGDINLDSEALNLALRGDPKKLRLTRLRTPITIKGTLDHPSVGIDAGKLAEQGAVATAMGTLLTPVAAVLAFIDPGLAKNKDCTASLAEAGRPANP